MSFIVMDHTWKDVDDEGLDYCVTWLTVEKYIIGVDPPLYMHPMAVWYNEDESWFLPRRWCPVNIA